MSIPIAQARQLAESLHSSRVKNLVAQSKAKQVLRDVEESQENYPNFETGLDDRVTFIGYGLLAAGCSLIEQEQLAEGREELRAAADMLESAHRSETANRPSSASHRRVKRNYGDFLQIRRKQWLQQRFAFWH